MDRIIARNLLEIGAVSLRVDPPFTWASGRLSPVYCDNRLLMAYPERRRKVSEAFVELLRRMGWSPDIIAGTATAGIPHAAWLAERLGLPMAYVRGEAKKHGKGNRVEGRIARGDKVVLVEDLISTGGSSIEAALGVTEAGADLLGVAAIFTYGLEKANEAFSRAGVRFGALTDFRVLMEVALEMQKLTPADRAVIADWQKDPAAWSRARGGGG